MIRINLLLASAALSFVACSAQQNAVVATAADAPRGAVVVKAHQVSKAEAVVARPGMLQAASVAEGASQPDDGYRLVWSDEFNNNGKPDSAKWGYEYGFVRNNELQWYQPDNANCGNGMLVIEAQKTKQPNPGYKEGSRDWRKSRPDIDYTSSCILTRGKGEWLYGRFELKARIDISEGIWPAWWTLGVSKPWPANGEIDIMEYYKGRLLANIACLGANRNAHWFSNTYKVDSLGGKAWAEQFHIWRMDWTKEYVALYVDDQLLNKVEMSELANKDNSGFNPFQQPHYMLINMAIGGMNGGDPSHTSFPRKYEVDYVRVYQKATE